LKRIQDVNKEEEEKEFGGDISSIMIEPLGDD
jgi:hypothetical protein